MFLALRTPPLERHYNLQMTKFYRALLLIYLLILGIAVFTPRRDLDISGALPPPTYTGSAIPTAAHNILYLGGFIAWFGNLLLLMPLPILIYKAFSHITLRRNFFICVTVSITIECVQHFIPGRATDIRDFLLNAVGVALIVWQIKVLNVSV